MSTPDQFKAVIAKYGSDTKLFLDNVLRECVGLVTEELVERTIYRSGRARSSYVWGYAPPLTAPNVTPDVEGRPSIEAAAAFADGLEAGGVIYVGNAVSYISDIEFGTADRAPAAMFRSVEARWGSIGKEATKRALR